MRQMTKLAAVGAMSLALVGVNAPAALADGYEIDREESTTNLAQCMVNQEVEAGELAFDVPGPQDLLDGGVTYNCTGNEVFVLNE